MATRLADRTATTASRVKRLALLSLLVSGVHLWLADQVWVDSFGFGATPTVRRMDVSFVRELRQEAPPTQLLAAPRTAPRAARSTAAMQPMDLPKPPEPAASAAMAELKVPVLAQAPADPVPTATAAAASTPTGASVAEAPPMAASAPLVADGAAGATARFEWPPSTRLSYSLLGNYRGAVDGQAQVEWLQRDGRYQVHLEVSVGPRVAPFMSRRMSSEGEVTPEGLRPRRYEEETRVVLRAPRRQVIELEDTRIVLPSGAQGPRPAGVQDSASQFVQMTWMFTVNPLLLQPGRSVEMPLALPRYVEPWTYEVLARQTLEMPFGSVETLHVRPRRAARAGDLTAEFWVAPTLQNLPVRILIRQDEQTYVDLTLLRLPQQADAGVPGR